MIATCTSRTSVGWARSELTKIQDTNGVARRRATDRLADRESRRAAERAAAARGGRGKVVLVTGASHGIGARDGDASSRAPARPCCCSRARADVLEELAGGAARGGRGRARLPRRPHRPRRDPGARRAAARRARPPDVVVNNAGKSIRRSIERSYDRFHDFTRTIDLNYLGPVRLLLALLPSMRARGEGHIVNVSTVGVLLPPTPRWRAYQASKAAFDVWLRSVAAGARARRRHRDLALHGARPHAHERADARLPARPRAHAGARRPGSICHAIVDRPPSIAPVVGRRRRRALMARSRAGPSEAIVRSAHARHPHGDRAAMRARARRCAARRRAGRSAVDRAGGALGASCGALRAARRRARRPAGRRAGRALRDGRGRRLRAQRRPPPGRRRRDRRARRAHVRRARRARRGASPPACGHELGVGRGRARSAVMCRNHRGFVEAIARRPRASAPTCCCSTPTSPGRSWRRRSARTRSARSCTTRSSRRCSTRPAIAGPRVLAWHDGAAPRARRADPDARRARGRPRAAAAARAGEPRPARDPQLGHDRRRRRAPRANRRRSAALGPLTTLLEQHALRAPATRS